MLVRYHMERNMTKSGCWELFKTFAQFLLNQCRWGLVASNKCPENAIWHFSSDCFWCRMDYVVPIFIYWFFSLQYHIDHNRAHFYIDDSATATALHKCSHKITDRDGYKVCYYFFFFKQFFWCISVNWNSHTQFFEILHVCMSASSPIVSFWYCC